MIPLGDIALQERVDEHATVKHGSTAINVIQRDWDQDTIEVYVSFQRRSLAIVKREPSLVMVAFVDISDRMGMALALFEMEAMPSWTVVKGLINGGLEITHFGMPPNRWLVTQARDGYIQLWPMRGALP